MKRSKRYYGLNNIIEHLTTFIIILLFSKLIVFKMLNKLTLNIFNINKI